MNNLNLSEHQIRQIAQIVQKELEDRYEKLLNKRDSLPFSGTQVVEVSGVVSCIMNEFSFSVLNKLRE